MTNPNCVPSPIIIFNCGADNVCHNGDDQQIGMGTKDANGNYIIQNVALLHTGEIIYATDGCSDPMLSPSVVVEPPQVAPLLSPQMIILLVGTLALVGLLGLARLRLTK